MGDAMASGGGGAGLPDAGLSMEMSTRVMAPARMRAVFMLSLWGNSNSIHTKLDMTEELCECVLNICYSLKLNY